MEYPAQYSALRAWILDRHRSGLNLRDIWTYRGDNDIKGVKSVVKRDPVRLGALAETICSGALELLQACESMGITEEKGNIMPLYHVTSPSIAYKICSSGIFLPRDQNPMNGDSVMNLANYDEPSTTFCGSNNATYDGACLVCAWNGDVLDPPENPWKWEPRPNYLHDAGNWRYFIPIDTPRGILVVTEVIYDDDKLNMEYPINSCIDLSGKREREKVKEFLDSVSDNNILLRVGN